MLATAGTSSAIFIIVFVVGAFVLSAWGFFDLLLRPTLACQVANVPKSRWMLTLGASGLTLLSSVSLVIVAHSVILMGFGALACIVGLAGGAWYLGTVRPWIAAQVAFAGLITDTD